LADFWYHRYHKYTIMSSKKLVTGLFIGAAAGLILGILFAPDKGTETRKKIAGNAGDIADDVKDVFNDLRDGISSRLSKLKSEAGELEGEPRNEWSN
jgi:gas vesicle protein